MEEKLERLGAMNFVTMLGWSLIGLTGLAVFSTLLQNIFFTIMLAMPGPHPADLARQSPGAVFPFRMLLGLLLAFSVLMLASAIAFLRRRNWARRTFILLFALAIALNALAVVLLGVSLVSSWPAAGATRFEIMMRLLLIPIGLAALGVCILFGWLIKRLTSATIRREFGDGLAA